MSQNYFYWHGKLLSERTVSKGHIPSPIKHAHTHTHTHTPTQAGLNPSFAGLGQFSEFS